MSLGAIEMGIEALASTKYEECLVQVDGTHPTSRPADSLASSKGNLCLGIRGFSMHAYFAFACFTHGNLVGVSTTMALKYSTVSIVQPCIQLRSCANYTKLSTALMCLCKLLRLKLFAGIAPLYATACLLQPSILQFFGGRVMSLAGHI